MLGFLKQQGAQKILVVILLLLLLIAIPITIRFGAQQQQTTSQHANTGGDNTDSCGLVTVKFAEQPAACTGSASVNPVVPSLSSYTTTATLTNTSSKTVSFGWVWAAHFCPKGSDRTGSNLACLLNTVLAKGECTLAPGQSCDAVSNAISPSVAGFSGQACGFYQNDFSFITKDLQCTYGSYDNVSTAPGGFSWCNAGHDCTTVTPTPTETPTPTPTPSETPTPTPTPTVTPTETPTPTPTQVVTPTPTQGVTPTPTPQPTLPPTGPGNTLVGIGVAGGVLAVVGVALLLAL